MTHGAELERGDEMKKMFVLTKTFLIKELYATEELYVGIKTVKASDGKTYSYSDCFSSKEEAKACGERRIANSVSRLERMLKNIRQKESNLSKSY